MCLQCYGELGELVRSIISVVCDLYRQLFSLLLVGFVLHKLSIMSSKRQRGESSKPSKAYDKKRFVSEAASERYHNVLASKALISKRGLKPHDTQNG